MLVVQSSHFLTLSSIDGWECVCEYVNTRIPISYAIQAKAYLTPDLLTVTGGAAYNSAAAKVEDRLGTHGFVWHVNSGYDWSSWGPLRSPLQGRMLNFPHISPKADSLETESNLVRLISRCFFPLLSLIYADFEFSNLPLFLLLPSYF